MGLLSEIAALAKAGYTVAEVRELISLAADSAKEPAPEQPEEKPEDQTKMPEKEQIPDPLPEESPAQSKDQSEDQSARIAELEKQLAAAQAANRKQDASTHVKNETEQLEDLARSFM